VVEQTIGNWIKLHRAGALKGLAGKNAVTAEQTEIRRLRAGLARAGNPTTKSYLGSQILFFCAAR
jgi:transposase-like protein